MTDIPTAPDNKPSNLRDILAAVMRFGMAFERDDLETGKHLFMNIDEAVAAITGLLPEKLPEQSPYKLLHTGFNAAIDTTLRNFSGQGEGEGE